MIEYCIAGKYCNTNISSPHICMASPSIVLYRPYSVRTLSTLEAMQCSVFTMVIHSSDAILSSRTTVAMVLPWFSTAYDGYSQRIVMLLWYCKWRKIPSQRIVMDYRRYEINLVNKVYSKTKTTHSAILSFVVILVCRISLGVPYRPYRYILKPPYQPPILYLSVYRYSSNNFCPNVQCWYRDLLPR